MFRDEIKSMRHVFLDIDDSGALSQGVIIQQASAFAINLNEANYRTSLATKAVVNVGIFMKHTPISNIGKLIHELKNEYGFPVTGITHRGYLKEGKQYTEEMINRWGINPFDHIIYLNGKEHPSKIKYIETELGFKPTEYHLIDDNPDWTNDKLPASCIKVSTSFNSHIVADKVIDQTISKDSLWQLLSAR